MDFPPSKGRRELAAELTKLRRNASLSGTTLGTQLGTSQSMVSKTERGTTLPRPEAVKEWARICGADEETTERLVSLARQLATESRSWAEEEGTLAVRNQEIGQVERDTTRLRNFQPSAISGLLQTADYARRVLMMLDPEGRRDIPAAVAARMERQTALYDTAKTFEFVLTEGALRWRPGPPQLMLAQLDRILSIATLPNVTIGVLPYDREATNLHLNGFTIFDRPDGSLLLLETYHGEDRIDSDDQKIEMYRQAFAGIREAAATGTDAATVIRAVMVDLQQRQ
jgi:transcriptional regulator with XRE-family HTH domain